MLSISQIRASGGPFDPIELDDGDLRDHPFLDRNAALARLLRGVEAGILSTNTLPKTALQSSPTFAAGVEYLCRELRRRAERSRASAQAEIGALELERHGGAGKRVGLEAPGNLFAELPKPALKRTKVGDIISERRFGRNAFGFAIRIDGSRIDAAGCFGATVEMRMPSSVRPPRSGGLK